MSKEATNANVTMELSPGSGSRRPPSGKGQRPRQTGLIRKTGSFIREEETQKNSPISPENKRTAQMIGEAVAAATATNQKNHNTNQINLTNLSTRQTRLSGLKPGGTQRNPRTTDEMANIHQARSASASASRSGTPYVPKVSNSFSKNINKFRKKRAATTIQRVWRTKKKGERTKRRNSHGGGPERFSHSSTEARRRIQMVTSEEHNRQLKEKNKQIAKLVERSAQLRTELTDSQKTISQLRNDVKRFGENTKESKAILANIMVQEREIKRMHNLASSYAEQLNKVKMERNMLMSQKSKATTVTKEDIQNIVKQVKQETNARAPTTPPGITKTNIERLLQPFKQPVSVRFAPTISVKGGSAKATGGSLEQVQIQHKSPVDKKKKKPLKLTRGPATARKQESAKFRNEIISKLRSPVAAKRREALYKLRTPTTGQRKKHVIELIDRVLRRMKVRADVEKKLIKFYESLSERHIKQLFGGRTKEEVKTILKKQVSYFSKKR